MALIEMSDLLSALGQESYSFFTTSPDVPASGVTSVEAVDTSRNQDWWRSVTGQAVDERNRVVGGMTEPGLKRWSYGGGRRVSVGGRPGYGTFQFRGWRRRHRVVV